MSPSRSLAAAVGLVAIIALVGCASPGALDASEPPEPSPSTSPEASAAEPDPSGEPEGVDTSDWLEYASDDDEISFRYPADWTIETAASEPLEDVGADGWRILDSAVLTTSYGQTLLRYADGVDLGGGCLGEDGEPQPLPLEVLFSEPLDSAPYPTDIATVALGMPDGSWYVGVGLLDPEYIAVDTHCTFNFATGSSQGLVLMGSSLDLSTDGDLWIVDTLDEAMAYTETEEHATLIEILRSVVLT